MIFTNVQSKGVKIWLDPHLVSFSTLVPLIRSHGAELSMDHASAYIVIINPAKSLHLFDRYCHPEWLPQSNIRHHQAEGEWKDKVIVTEDWPGRCVAAGRMLGEADNWGGCRKGAPPKSSYPAPAINPIFSQPAVRQQAEETVGDGVISSKPLEPLPSKASLPVVSPPPPIFTYHQAGPSKRQTPLPQGRSSVHSANPVDNQAGPSRKVTTTGRARPSPGSKHSTKELDEIFRNAHPLSFTEGKAGRDVPIYLAKTHRELHLTTWRNYYKEWLAASGRFSELAADTDHLAHVRIFTKRLAAIKKGKSLADVSARLALRHPERNASEWSRLMGNWLRTMRRGDESSSKVVDDSRNERAQITALPNAPKSTAHILIPRAPHQQSVSIVKPPTGIQPLTHSRFGSYLAQSHEKYTIDELDDALRNAHPLHLLQGKSISELKQYLHETYPELGRSSWKNKYDSWIEGTERFKTFPTEIGYLAHVDTFTQYLSRIRKGMSLRDVSSELAISKPELQENEWNIRLGDWVRSMPSQQAGSLGESKMSTASQKLFGGDNAHAGPSRVLETEMPPGMNDQIAQPNSSSKLSKKLSNHRETANNQDFEVEAVTDPDTDEGTEFQGENSSDEEFHAGLRNLAPGVGSRRQGYSGKSQPRQGYPAAELDEILRSLHPLSLKDGGRFIDVLAELAKRHKQLSPQSWRNTYRHWRQGTGRCWTLPLDTTHLAFVTVFTPYYPLIVKGVALDYVVEKIVQDHPAHRKSVAEWKVHFGNWLRALDPASVASPTSVPRNKTASGGPIATLAATDASHVGQPTRTQQIDEWKENRLLHAKIFKQDYEGRGAQSKDIGAEVGARTGSHPDTISVWYRQWQSRSGRFEHVPEEFQPALSSASPAAKRKATSPRPHQPKRQKIHITESEETKMVTYILRRSPMTTEPFEEDWEEFGKLNPGHSVKDWTEHYRLYRARINDLVSKLGGTIEGRRSSSGRSSLGRGASLGTASKTSVRMKRAPGKPNGEGMVIDLCSSDEEEWA